MKTWVVMNDLQIPFHSVPALDIAFQIIRDVKPTGVVLNGDIVDCYTLSEFAKSPLTHTVLLDEIALAGELMERLAGITYIAHRVWIGGNHEDRLRRYVWKHAPQLGELASLGFSEIFKLDKYGFQWYPYGQWISLGKLIVTHGSMVRTHSSYSARAHYDRFGTSVLIGHTHRMGQYHVRTATSDHVAVENGCLCRLDPEYESYPNWQQGFCFVHVHDDGLFTIEQVRILNERIAVYGGNRYEYVGTTPLIGPKRHAARRGVVRRR